MVLIRIGTISYVILYPISDWLKFLYQLFISTRRLYAVFLYSCESCPINVVVSVFFIFLFHSDTSVFPFVYIYFLVH